MYGRPTIPLPFLSQVISCAPGQGRFLNQDPIGYAGGMNLYNFAGNDPADNSDPSGLDYLNQLANGAGGFGAALTGGGTEYLGNLLSQALGLGNAYDVVDKCSAAYMGGMAFGTVAAIASGDEEGPALETLSESGVDAEVLAECINGGANSGPGWEIGNGVRRAKAAQLAGESTVSAVEIGSDGEAGDAFDVPVSNLYSPYKSSIDLEGSGMDRWKGIIEGTLNGDDFPPIEVRPGTNGTPLSGVGFSYGDD